jgi:hypothetical protein
MTLIEALDIAINELTTISDNERGKAAINRVGATKANQYSLACKKLQLIKKLLETK